MTTVPIGPASMVVSVGTRLTLSIARVGPVMLVDAVRQVQPCARARLHPVIVVIDMSL